MGRYLCPLEDVHKLADKGFVVVRLDDGKDIGIILLKGQLHAFRNHCPHLGGPVCLGDVIGRTEVELGEHQRIKGEYVSDEDIRVVCPWHGIEFNIESGICLEDPRWRLKRVNVYVDDGAIYADID